MALAMAAAFSMTSCKSKKAVVDATEVVDPASIQEVSTATTTTNYSAPVSSYTPATTTTTNRTYDDSAARTESITTSEGTLQAYSVVVGAFGNKSNANAYRDRMKGRNYQAFLVQNARGLWRVVAYTSNDYNAVVAQRDKIRTSYASDGQGLASEAWILKQ